MRSIKFRAHNKELKRVFAVLEIDWRCKTLEARFDEKTIVDWEFDQVDFLAFTNLLDKNGKEIWEGDVVKWAGGIMPVFHSERLNRWMMGTPKGCEEISLRAKYVGVLGNIYENPALLKGETQT